VSCGKRNDEKLYQNKMFTRMEFPIFLSVVGFYTLKGVEFKHAK
jgi:hypothetical protein